MSKPKRRGALRTLIKSATQAFHATSNLPSPQEETIADRLLRRAEAASGYTALAIIGPPSGWPCTIAISKHPRDIYRQAKRWNFDAVTVHHLAWCIDRAHAERLGEILETILSVHQRPGHSLWLDLDAALIASQLERAAEKANVQIFDEIERRQRLEMIVNRAITKIAQELEAQDRAGVEAQLRSDNVVALPTRRTEIPT
jgi:hypothetical protein